ncbi:solute carrier family 25 member 40-like isoform X2 [Scaptodrosophila lebanonensis]|uniref:Solute carrier family 25 member 40-like isoform X2 n=1 Tax=Drosophila lebanonensis TaxID=7225 RepID=A0A6J2TTS6_DROLE|nr:solute carrier family 25 member 40-like isoform X2 [Scaptodrosophila lebanonensis]
MKMPSDENTQRERHGHEHGQSYEHGQEHDFEETSSSHKEKDVEQEADLDPLRLPTSVLIEDPRYRIKPMQQVVSALIGGLITTFVVTPLEVVKTRVQTQHTMRHRPTVSRLCYVFHNGLMTHICKPNASECLPRAGSRDLSMRPLRGAMILCSSGITGLWAGLSPTLVSALPSTIIYFLTYEYLKHSFANLYYMCQRRSLIPRETGGTGSRQEMAPPTLALPYMVPMASGICARTVVVTAITPIEMVRIKMQSGYMTYAELWLVLRSLIRTQGVLGLWRGWPPTVMRDAPFSGTYWAAYESLKRAFDVTEPTFWFSFITGAASGALATWVTMPFDLITTHTQIELGQDVLYTDSRSSRKVGNGIQATSATAGAATGRQSVFARLGVIYRQHGLRGLYIGVMPRMLRVVPACAIMISTFEYSKAFFFHYNLDLQETACRRAH